MKDLEEITFTKTEQIPKYEEYYSYFLNKLIEVRKERNETFESMGKVFECSKGTIYNFEKRIKDLDFKMLFKYAGYFDYNIEMFMKKMTYNEIMSK